MPNKMKYPLLFLLFVNVLSAQEKKSFTFDCYLKNNLTSYVYLDYEGKRDSCEVINNHFSFKGTVEKGICTANFFVFPASGMSREIYIENTHIIMEASTRQRPAGQGMEATYFDILSIKGSPTCDLSENFEIYIKDHQNDKDFPQLLYAKVDAIVSNNPKNPIAGNAIFRAMFKEVLDDEKLRTLWAKVDKVYQDGFPLMKIENRLNPQTFVTIHGPIFDFTLPDRNNKPFNTETLKGKWILIHFWASWCGPCHEQLPELKRIAALYKNKNLQIVAVSVDQKIEYWNKDLDKQSPNDNFDWINLIQDKGSYGPIAIKYNVSGIPDNFLINPEGKVVAIDNELEPLNYYLKGL